MAMARGAGRRTKGCHRLARCGGASTPFLQTRLRVRRPPLSRPDGRPPQRTRAGPPRRRASGGVRTGSRPVRWSRAGTTVSGLVSACPIVRSVTRGRKHPAVLPPEEGGVPLRAHQIRGDGPATGDLDARTCRSRVGRSTCPAAGPQAVPPLRGSQARGTMRVRAVALGPGRPRALPESGIQPGCANCGQAAAPCSSLQVDGLPRPRRDPGFPTRPTIVTREQAGFARLMHKIRIMTVSDSAPVAVLDKVLTAAEAALEAAGAQRVWVERESRALAVMAELPVGQT
jgi:hypothetical protein